MFSKRSIIRVMYIFLFLVGTNIIDASTMVDADIVVAADGSGDFTTIQAAIDAAPSNSDVRTVIYLKRGLYNTEKLIVPAEKKNLTIIGESREESIISYHIYDCATGKCPTEDAALWIGDVISTSATLTIMAEGFRAENLTIQNTAGPVGQAQAITVRGDKAIFINCDIKGYQDTMYFWNSGKRGYFEGCLIVGRTDYIYGDGIEFFQGCEVRSWGGGWITAPSTPKDQDYGFIFNECNITYATSSPRAGDDGTMIALGRPWHEYPKVSWLYCDMTEMIDPLGWPTKWNMDYADTSADLKLYEYQNIGAGADMSGRANWVGIRALTAGEAPDYTMQNVLGGSDSWDPTAEPPLVKTYTWTGLGATDGWMVPENWDTISIPGIGESAVVDSIYTIIADGGTFEADLALSNGAILNVSESSVVTYLSIGKSTITAAGNDTLGGKIKTKDTLTFDVTGSLTLNAELLGVHRVIKKSEGIVKLTGDNSDFSGTWQIDSGIVDASGESTLGKGTIEVNAQGNLIVNNSDAFNSKSKLKVITGATLEMNVNIFLSEFYIDGTMQLPGDYTSATNPGLISGTGIITVGRPTIFNFIGGTDGKWDNPAHYSPALLPQAGDTVIVEREIETTSWVFPARMILTNAGNIRMRGAHSATGVIEMNADSRINYATSGTGFSLNAPILILGDVTMSMSSGNISGSSLTLSGSIEGDDKVTADNIRDLNCIATLIISGDNSGFTGTWDATKTAYHDSSIIAIKGAGENSFGKGRIEAAGINKIILGHKKCAGDTLNLVLSDDARAELSVDVYVDVFFMNDVQQDTGTYTAISHPDWFTGEGALKVGIEEPVSVDHNLMDVSDLIYVANNNIYIFGDVSFLEVFNMNGMEITQVLDTHGNIISVNNLGPGVYITKFTISGQNGVLKFAIIK